MNVAEAVRPGRASSPVAPKPARVVPAGYLATKRFLDVVTALAVLLLSSPIVLLAALGVIVVSGGSPFFLQERVGKGGRPFKMVKLRTMVRGAHLLHADMLHMNEVEGPVFKMRDDPRLHPLGAFLRRTSIDELPNFLNVLRGEMSAVGPRPPLPSEVASYDAYAMRRLEVNPGVTGLWQISGRCEVSFDEWMALDNAYIDEWSPLMDLQIILRTIPAVIRGIGAH
ncbi:MAG: sugar transferase [Candidatus Velthaea sp.]|jgi:lipopolysaccharide/colanic/teichoic acid biosynthesis glycosyltransferase